MATFFKKSKNPNFGAILSNFYPNLGKNEFSWKKGLCQFLNILIIYHGAKNLRKVTTHSDKNAELLMHKQTENSGFIEQWFYRTLHRTGIQKIKFGTE